MSLLAASAPGRGVGLLAEPGQELADGGTIQRAAGQEVAQGAEVFGDASQVRLAGGLELGLPAFNV